MLGKLIKYEFQAFGRIMMPLYGLLMIVSMVFAGIMRLSMNGFARFLLDKFAIISGFVFAAAIIAVMVVMVVMIIQRFYRNLLGTEGYLMFTLPVTTLDNILSKGITALIWIVIGGITGIISGMLMVVILGNFQEFLSQLRDAMEILEAETDLTRNMILFLVIMICGLLSTIVKVYAAIALGHQWSNHRVMGAVIAYIGIGIVEIIFASIPGVRTMLGTNTFEFSLQRATLNAVVVSLLQIAAYGALTWALLDKRLNLE